MDSLNNNPREHGLTLIELLIVILIIGILAGLLYGVVNRTGIGAKGRDFDRIADLKKIQNALELYYIDYRKYPDTLDNWTDVNESGVAGDLTPLYLKKLPKDPLGDGEYVYRYLSLENGTVYLLAAKMELEHSNTSGPCMEVLGMHISGVGYTDIGTYCYGVKRHAGFGGVAH